MNKTRDGLLLSSAQSAPLTIEEKWSINMGEAGEKTDCPVSVVLLSVPVWYPAGSGGGGGCFLFTIRSSVLVTTSVLFVLFVLVVFFDRVINAISGHSWNSYGRGWGGGGEVRIPLVLFRPLRLFRLFRPFSIREKGRKRTKKDGGVRCTGKSPGKSPVHPKKKNPPK